MYNQAILLAAEDLTHSAGTVLEKAKIVAEKALNQMLHPEELFDEKMKARIVNAIVKFQSNSILQEGVVSIHLTVGADDTLAFATRNELDRKRHKPYYTVIPKDISNEEKKEIYLWYLEGGGRDCICKLTVHPKPSNVSAGRLKDIAYELKRPLRWNPKKETFKNDAEANALLGRPMLNEWGIKI